MYKKLVDLQNQLQSDKEQLENDVRALQVLAEKTTPRPFDELLAARRITTAKTNDHMNGTHTADSVIQAVDKDREEATKNLEKTTAIKANAQQQHTQKAAALQSIYSELHSLKCKIKALIDAEAKQRLTSKIEEYSLIASGLLNALIEIDALNAVISEDPQDDIPRLALRVDSLPTIGLESAEPWLVVAGEKMILPREQAFAAVHNRHLEIIEEIEGELYGN